MLDTIRDFHQRYDYLLDPHTAVGVSVAMRLAAPSSADPLICLSTAHGAKFPDAIRLATGKDLARHPAIHALSNLPTRCENLPNDAHAVRELIKRTLATR